MQRKTVHHRKAILWLALGLLTCSCHQPRDVQHDGRTMPTPRRAPSVIVDAGHGGKDPGALGVGPLDEKTINLRIASEVPQRLLRQGASVQLTRDGDEFIALDDRAALAERSATDLFVSIHCDACPRPEVYGATVYIANNARPESKAVARKLAASFQRFGIPCRGIRRAGFRVLVGHSRPSVLIECGYLTNEREAALLATTAHQRRVAEAVASGIEAHFASAGR